MQMYFNCDDYNKFLNTIFNWVYCALLYIENDAEIFPSHYTAEKGFKMDFMTNKLAINHSCEIILENKNNVFARNHCEIQVRTILICSLYSIKYDNKMARILGSISTYDWS